MRPGRLNRPGDSLHQRAIRSRFKDLRQGAVLIPNSFYIARDQCFLRCSLVLVTATLDYFPPSVAVWTDFSTYVS